MSSSEIVVLGAAHASALPQETRAEAARVSVVEPDGKILSSWLAREDVSAIARGGRLRLYTQPTPDAVAAAWAVPSAGQAMARLVFLDGAGSRPDRRAFFAEVERRIRDRERDASLDTGTLVALGTGAVENVLANLPLLSRSARTRGLQTALRGKPGFVIAAGPSLDKNARELARVGDAGVLIAVDTAVKPLARHGVRPHLVISLDSRQRNVKNVEGADLSESYLICEIATHPQLVRLPSRGRALFVAENVLGDPLLRLGFEMDRIKAFGSVATAAFDLACQMDLDPVVFVGQDLAYTDGRAYCAGTTPGGSPPGPESEEVWITDPEGRPVRTTLRLLAFRDWIEEAVAREIGRVVINATEGGILRRGCTLMKLDDAVSRYVSAGENVSAALRAALGDPAADETTLARAFERFRREAASGLEHLRAAQTHDPRAALGALAARKELTAFVEVVEAGELLTLRHEWSRLPSPDRERRLFSALARGCERVLNAVDRALSEFSRAR